ncbi:MAG: glutamine synthetase III [Clostridia bacterium]|nr:glutamine synthetase III [Clostridia bacterium]
MDSITTNFADLVFNDKAMRERMPEAAYATLKDTIRIGKPLNPDIADIVADAMKAWAIEKGATHYTHWFQPLTGVTAEKHEGFLGCGADGLPVIEFSGKELIMSEPDASSFPSGGLRPTFEARGYTAWDPTSFAFIKDSTLCIPTLFFAYSGDALDKKTPLLRSMELIDRESLRILRLFGHNDVSRVTPTAGAEQEYFLVDKELYDKRPDLVFCSRTLFGAKPPKGQEMEDHYYGAISRRVSLFMRDLDNELWQLGVFAKTEHKEVAPGQYELAPIFSDANTATDHNQLVMEMMKTVALRHGLVCILHEKPFQGMNGSGKHNNWSLSTDTGMNILAPGKSPKDNLQFLLFLAAVIKAVDKHQDLLRVCVAGANNDWRLGGFEAPPSIVSIFLGDTLYDLLASIEHKEEYEEGGDRILESGICTIPRLRIDTTDRNRTSPFAFTGNKFEFRMLGSSQSIADANTVINTIVAESLAEFADRLEKAEDFRREAFRIIRHTMREHKRILYNGNNYSEEWVKEAEARGLLNLRTTVDALPRFIAEENIALFSERGIYTRREMVSRYDISLENYIKLIRIEANTMITMAQRMILPAVIGYETKIAEAVSVKDRLGVPNDAEYALLRALSDGISALHKGIGRLFDSISTMPSGHADAAAHCRDAVLPAMTALRATADSLEVITAKEAWPFPGYDELLFSL